VTKVIAILAAVLLSFAALPPAPGMAQSGAAMPSDPAAVKKFLEDKMKMTPPPGFERKFEQPLMTSRVIECTDETCVCSGFADCLALARSGACTDADAFICFNHGTLCGCVRHPGT